MSTMVAVLAWEMKEFLIGLIRFDEKRELLLMLSFNLKKVFIKKKKKKKKRKEKKRKKKRK